LGKKVPIAFNDADTSAPGARSVGARSVDLVEAQKQLGLPLWKDLSKQHEELAARHGVSFSEGLKDKIDLYKRFTDYQTALYLNFSSAGSQNMMVFHNVTDLQMKIFELEEELKSKGINPLMSSEWMDARKQLQKELEFIQKHKLDVANFQATVQKRKEKVDDDDLFIVEGKATE
jgi:hypothetical protein